jgi:orotate phosphoribosyltransferase
LLEWSLAADLGVIRTHNVTRQELAGNIAAASRLTGVFRLRSGTTSNVYWDKYRFESRPELLAEIAIAFQPLLPAAVSHLAGLELGGVPLATALSLRTGLPCLFVRKAAKSYGTMAIVEGAFRPGDRAVVIEDVVTSGGQVCESIAEMRKLGLVVEDALCVIDREQSGEANLARLGCTLRSLFRQQELESLAGAG